MALDLDCGAQARRPCLSADPNATSRRLARVRVVGPLREPHLRRPAHDVESAGCWRSFRWSNCRSAVWCRGRWLDAADQLGPEQLVDLTGQSGDDLPQLLLGHV